MKRCYKSCHDLPKYNFDEIIDNKNLNWLLKDYDGDEIKTDVDLGLLWKDIFNEYIILKNDEEAKEYYRVNAELEELKEKLEKLKVLTYLYGLNENSKIELDIIKHLSAIGYPVDRNKPKKDELDKLIRNKKSLLTNINRIKLQHQDILKSEEKKVKTNREQEVADVEFILSKNFIDRKKTTVAKWLAYLSQCSSKIKAQKNARRKS